MGHARGDVTADSVEHRIRKSTASSALSNTPPATQVRGEVWSAAQVEEGVEQCQNTR